MQQLHLLNLILNTIIVKSVVLENLHILSQTRRTLQRSDSRILHARPDGE